MNTIAQELRAATTKRARPPKSEAVVLASVLRYVRIHPKVAWIRRINTGAVKMHGARYMTFGFVGCSDLIGQLTDGRFLAIECKSDKGQLTDEQQQFLDRVNRHGGVAGMVRSIDDAEGLLNG